VLVTGAARGIGRQVALRAAGRGARVVVTARSTDERPNPKLPGTLEGIARELTEAGAAGVLTVPADLARAEDVQRVADTVLQECGRCDVLIANAAVSFPGSLLEVAVSRWRAVLQVNLLAHVELIQRLVPGMIERRSGRVVLVGSGSAQDDGVPELPYSIAKLGLERLAVGAAHEWAGSGVGVDCVRIDGIVPTEVVALHVPELLDQAVVTVDEMALALLWVASRPGNETGQVFTLEQLRVRGAMGERVMA
jgi:NAD(P)-dependent dehydrogenase (short-subunit alcohol dehydrogenase family)